MSCALHRSLAGFLVLALLLLSIARPATADEPAKPKIRALLVTGGCCHDYKEQKTILSEGISARAPVEWTIAYDPGTSTNIKFPIYENPDWAKGFDVVVHNECVSDVKDLDWIERILKPHREGLPAVVIHCAMHCYRGNTEDWFKFLGVTSRRHGANYPFEVINLEPQNPIMKGFGEKWQTPKGELYIIEKLWPTAKPLAHAMSRDTNNNEICIWTNQFEKGRVFGTTVGHHNEEMSDPVFLDYVTRGLLWSVDKLDDQHFKPVAAAPAAEPSVAAR
ncbi:MAG TPA: ThuA domain-containing protein [Pirellulales bacterium]|jgi:type 1 glutamine amidotransferase|nr:ThuA domain-containing protein [Pirellulales bacterium]